MKTFGEFLYKRGYSWNDFDRAYQMENLIEQYAEERVDQELTIPAVVGQSEQLVSNCQGCGEVKTIEYCEQCYAENLPDIAY